MTITQDPRLPPLPLRFLHGFAILRHDKPANPRFGLVLLSVLSLSLLMPVRATSQASDQEIQSSFRAGQAALRQGDFNQAVEQFKKVLALAPGLVEAEVNLGLAYQSLLDFDTAARYLSNALRQRPNLPGLNVIVGMDYIKLGKPETAAPYLRHALELDASSQDAHDAMALYDLTQDNVQGAAEQYHKVADLDPDKPEALFKIGHQYLDLAARLAYRGARLYPDSPWGHRFLGDTLLERARWEDAAREYQKALVLDPKQAGLHALVGESLLHNGKLEEAEVEFRHELQLDPKNERAWLGLASVQIAKGQPVESLSSVSAAWQSSPEFLELHSDLLLNDLNAESEKASVSRLLDQPETPAKHFLLTAFYTSLNDNASSDLESQSFQKDLALWKQTASQAGAHSDSCKLHHYSQCLVWLEKTTPLTSSVDLLLGKTHFLLQQYEPAAQALAKVHGDKDANAEASYWLERTYQALAADSYARLESTFPDSWRTHALRAEGFALRADPDNAIKEYQAALDLRPNEAELHESLGEFYLDNHSDQDAQRELARAATIDPSRTKTLYLLGRLYVLDNENEKAVPILQRALQLQPNLNEASALLGTVYLRMGKFADAVPRLEKAAALDHMGNIHYQLFQAYRKLGQNELAEKALARSQDIRRSSLEHDQALIMGSRRVEAEQPEQP
jgi:tetratricopeptide (TPR) repeat protein